MAIHHYFEDGTDFIESEEVAVVQARAIHSINEMRDARIDGGFTFHHGGSDYLIQSRQSDRENVIGLSIAASGAIAAGAQPGNLEWLIPGQPFGFITADNQVIPLDAFGVIALYQQALAFKSGVTLYARALKDQVLACETDEAVSLIGIGAGWPS